MNPRTRVRKREARNESLEEREETQDERKRAYGWRWKNVEKAMKKLILYITNMPCWENHREEKPCNRSSQMKVQSHSFNLKHMGRSVFIDEPICGQDDWNTIRQNCKIQDYWTNLSNIKYHCVTWPIVLHQHIREFQIDIGHSLS